MTPEAKFRDPEIHCSKFGDLSDTRRQLQGPPVNFSLICDGLDAQQKELLDQLASLANAVKKISIASLINLHQQPILPQILR
jgi:hypothetical protein